MKGAAITWLSFRLYVLYINVSPIRGLYLNELFTIKALRKLRIFMRTMPLRGFLIRLNLYRYQTI